MLALFVKWQGFSFFARCLRRVDKFSLLNFLPYSRFQIVVVITHINASEQGNQVDR